MTLNILGYGDIVTREDVTIQRGMNYRPKGKPYSIILMSLLPNSPYGDAFVGDDKHLYYEGEDISAKEKRDPKRFDQAMFTPSGGLTNNGKFVKAIDDYKFKRVLSPEKIKVYDKVASNVWTDRGWYFLANYEYVLNKDKTRRVFKFLLTPISEGVEESELVIEEEHIRNIPPNIKRLVWARDKGRCVLCGSQQNLHFDHIIPFSKGGSSSADKNIQILCAKHNLQKSNSIQ